MNKKILCFILISLMLIFALASCGGKDDGRTACEINGHSFAAADCLSARTCTVCGYEDGTPLGHDYTETVADEAHIRTTAEDCTERDTYWYSCSRCDAIAGNDNLALDKWYETEQIGEHTVALDWVNENGQHFHKCVNDGCDYTEGRETCSGGSATCQARAECSTCGNTYGELGGHSINADEWGYIAADGHAHTCTLCGHKDGVTPHNPNISAATEEADKLCLDCGFVIESRLPHTHTPDTAFEFDTTHHWQDCVKNDGQEYGKAEHSFDNACDTDCNGGCGYTREVEHDYTVTQHNGDEHWIECSVCGKEKTGSRVTHTYTREVTVAAKTFTEGKAVNTCSCGESYNETIAPTKTLRLLAVGNSFAIDALTHLCKVARDAGVENITLGYLHIGGCTLDIHYANMSGNVAAYTFGVSNAAGTKMENYNGGEKVTASFGLTYADWDYITIQQGSHDSGLASTYAPLNDGIAYIRGFNTHAELLWHMTWAYAAGSTHSGFANYGNDQVTMYNAILSAVQSQILTNTNIVGIIPSGTTIQNMRNTHLGDTINRDGYHLTTGIGRYAAALTYLVAVTGYDLADFVPTGLADDVATHMPCITESVTNAIANPFAVTPSEKYPYVAPSTPSEPPAVEESKLLALTEEDVAYLTSLGLNPNEYAVYDFSYTVRGFYNSTEGSHLNTTHSTLSPKFIATEILDKDVLTNGSVIHIADGYQYRPDGWTSLDTTTSKANRPGNVSTESVIIDDAWWSIFNYRGFNISAIDEHKMTEAEASVLKIYVKVA